MSNKWILLILGVILVFLQYIFYPFLNIGHFIPDLAIIYLVLLSLKSESGFVFIMAFLLGLLQDLFLSQFVGISSIGNLLAVYPIIIFSRSKILETPSFLWKITLMVAIKSLFVYYLIFLKNNYGITHIFIYYSLPTIFYTLAVGFIIILLFKNMLEKYVSS